MGTQCLLRINIILQKFKIKFHEWVHTVFIKNIFFNNFGNTVFIKNIFFNNFVHTVFITN